jgi:hypothetical protein
VVVVLLTATVYFNFRWGIQTIKRSRRNRRRVSFTPRSYPEDPEETAASTDIETAPTSACSPAAGAVTEPNTTSSLVIAQVHNEPKTVVRSTVNETAATPSSTKEKGWRKRTASLFSIKSADASVLNAIDKDEKETKSKESIELQDVKL